MLYQAWQQLVERTQDLETMLAITRLLERAGAQQLTAVLGDAATGVRLDALLAGNRLEMLRARLAPETSSCPFVCNAGA